MLLALKVEEGATGQGLWADSRRKRRGNRFFPRVSRKNSTNTVILAQRDHFRLLTYRTVRQCVCVV